MKIFLGSDHRGFEMKEKIKPWLVANGYDVTDCGNTVYDKDDDFTDYAFLVSEQVAKNPNNRGIMFCASGTGMMIAANKVVGIRCGVSLSVEEAIFSRKHTDINMISIAVDFTGEALIKDIIGAFLTTPFEQEERFLRRIGKIRKQEEKI